MKLGFTLVGDTQLDGRICMNRVARATHQCNQKRKAVVDAFASAFNTGP